MTNNKTKNLLLLLLWVGVGVALRFTNLTAKPPWTDEFATFVYTLGNNFQNVPLDKAIALDVLMQPLQPNPAMGIGDVIQKLLTEDVHPPVYFVLAHLWMQMFPPEGGLISLWGARSLPALIGVASIPAIYWLSKTAFRSPLVGHLTAAMMAVSPYAIFLSQEARHYSLAALWVIASLGCLVVAVQYIQAKKPISIWLTLTWIGINTLGIATHYFVILTICAEVLALIALNYWSSVFSRRTNKEEQKSQELAEAIAQQRTGTEAVPLPLYTPQKWRLVAVAVGTLVGALVWFPQWQHTYGTPHTDWLNSGSRSLLEWINPVFQSFAAWLTMLCLLPVESPFFPVVIASGFVMLIFLIWAMPILIRGFKTQWRQKAIYWEMRLFSGFVLGAIALFFAISYGLGLDITRGARYNFVYFPGVIVLLGVSLAAVWNAAKDESVKYESINLFLISLLKNSGRRSVSLILLVGLLSGLTVACNLGYQKYYRPDLFVPIIQQKSHQPVLIATTHKTLVQTGEMMGLGKEFKRLNSNLNPQFLLAHQRRDPNTSTDALRQTLTQLPRPLDLWLVNFHAPIPQEVKKCLADYKSSVDGDEDRVNGYEYQLFHCK